MTNKMCPLESKEAISLISIARYNPILRHHLIAIPNGGYRNEREAAKLKREGVKAGVSDYFLAFPVRKFHGLWLELKRKNKSTSRLSEAQKIWIDRMISCGYCAEVAYGADHAIKIINDYLNDQLQSYN